jgi:hypothetical protein
MPLESSDGNELDDEIDDEQVILGDLLNHVLDKGVVITGSVTISIADVDLLMVDLRLLLTSIETSIRHGIDGSVNRMIEGDAG